MGIGLAILGLILVVVVIFRCQAGVLRKCLSLSLVPISCLIAGLLFDSYIGVLWVLAVWLTIPGLEVFLRYRGVLIEPVRQLFTPCPNIYLVPHTEQALEELEDEGYDLVDSSSWRWEGMNKHFQFYWHPEKRAIASLVICEQANLVFSYLNLRSFDSNGNSWRTTNFPFSPTLAPVPTTQVRRIPCEESSFLKLQKRHDQFLEKFITASDDLVIPDPDIIKTDLRQEMMEQIQWNLSKGLIKQHSDGEYTYSAKGLLYRWWIAVKDLIRLC